MPIAFTKPTFSKGMLAVSPYLIRQSPGGRNGREDMSGDSEAPGHHGLPERLLVVKPPEAPC